MAQGRARVTIDGGTAVRYTPLYVNDSIPARGEEERPRLSYCGNGEALQAQVERD